MKKFGFISIIILLLQACGQQKKVTVAVANPSTINRQQEIVEISYKNVFTKLKAKQGGGLVVKDNKGGLIPYQVTHSVWGNNDSLLIFPVSVSAKSAALYTIQKAKPVYFEPKVYGRLVPERKDDFTWENDKIAFRVYGPALQATGEISSGIDVWAKRTDKLIIDKWYAEELGGKKTYHTDAGEGLDFYKVGPTLGAGAAAPFVNDKLWYSKNFTSYQIIDNGPLRITVKLTYAPFRAGENNVAETRIISLDAGSQLNKIKIIYNFSQPALTVASGIVMRASPLEKTFIQADKKYFTHADPPDKLNGILYQGIVAGESFNNIEIANGHILGLYNVKPGVPYIYYTGGGWSKFGFIDFAEWNKYVDVFTQKLKNPLQVTLR